eukprot:339171-Pyramimonas_sp.AAC.1
MKQGKPPEDLDLNDLDPKTVKANDDVTAWRHERRPRPFSAGDLGAFASGKKRREPLSSSAKKTR